MSFFSSARGPALFGGFTETIESLLEGLGFDPDVKVVDDVTGLVADVIDQVGPQNPATPGLLDLLGFLQTQLAPLIEVSAVRGDPFDGTPGLDIFIGDFTRDVARGGDGFDILVGRTGRDELDGGEGGDIVLGGFGRDLVSGGAGNDILDGGFGRDLVDGGEGADVVKGGFGNDVVIGGAGNDIVEGGRGRDTFVVVKDADVDLILDFDVVHDTLDLSAFGIVAIAEGMLIEGQLSNGAEGTTLVLDSGTSIVEFVGLSAAELAGADVILA